MAEVVAAPPMVAPLPVRRCARRFDQGVFRQQRAHRDRRSGPHHHFLFREGFGFFGRISQNIRLYRRAGLE